jgi:uncharacterized protein with PQ loop repeat
MSTIYGWTATTLSLLYKFPQMYTLFKYRKTDGLSIVSVLVQTTAYGFYIAHGIIIEDPPIFYMGAIALAQSLVVIVLYFYINHQTSSE